MKTAVIILPVLISFVSLYTLAVSSLNVLLTTIA